VAEWCRDVELRLEEDRHAGQRVPHGDQLDIGHRRRPRVVRSESEWLVGRQLEVLFNEPIPDGLVDPLGIALAGREQIDDQQVHALRDQVRGLLNEGAQLVLARLVPRRDDLDHGDGLAIELTDRDSIRPADVDPILAQILRNRTRDRTLDEGVVVG
jgi:hypothetical protein